MIGKLIPVDLREIWKNEARNFTKWLNDNLDILNEQTGLDLTSIETEKSVGTFSADIFAEDRTGRLVIIENQLERTDHDHLGKVITYLSNLDAKIGIWITSEPRQEHITAVNYLNEIAPDDTHFYIIKIEAFRIADSEAAPLFSVVAGPNPEISAGGKFKKELAERDQKRFDFFEQLLELSNKSTSLFNNVSPVGYQNWIWAGAGKSGLSWAYVIMVSKARVELYMGSSNGDLNKKRFDYLFSNKGEIEQQFGEQLEWNYKEGRQQHYIRSWSQVGGLENEESWFRIQEDLVNRMSRLQKAVGDYISELE
jgi:hypothetical protein